MKKQTEIQTKTQIPAEKGLPPTQKFKDLPGKLIAPFPLFPLQPILARIVNYIEVKRPELFERLGDQKDKCFLIDPLNLPFVLLLCPDPFAPSLKAYRTKDAAQKDRPYDASIAGTFLTLLDMVDGRLDGDALFFTRDLIIQGDVEAVVTLRNALDDLDGNIIDDVVSSLGIFVRPLRTALIRLRKIRSHYINAK
jgi:predicted lipid carrier protein YhbT